MSAVVALSTVIVRVHNIVAFPALRDFDAAGHALNVVDLLERRANRQIPLAAFSPLAKRTALIITVSRN